MTRIDRHRSASPTARGSSATGLSGRPRDGRGRPDRRAHRRLAGRADDADPQPDPGQAARRVASPARSSTQMEQVMGTCLDRGDQGRVERRRARPGWLRRGRRTRSPTGSGWRRRSPTSTATTCCPGSPSSSASGALRPFVDRRASSATHDQASSPPTPTSAAGGSSRRSPQGADIVITGRVTDAAVTCGPAAWHHGWAARRLGRTRRRRRRRPRDRVQRPGDGRQLLVLHRGAGHRRGSASRGPRSRPTARR